MEKQKGNVVGTVVVVVLAIIVIACILFYAIGVSHEEKTIGSIYNDEMIGQSINYTSNGENDWIIFGKDSSGNILITTSKPVDIGFKLKEEGAEAWINYENELNNACAIYGENVQGKNLLARSITLEDINYVAGVVEPEFETYTFGTTYDVQNNQVNFYFPSESSSAENCWINAEKLGESVEFKDNLYWYYPDGGTRSGYYWDEVKDDSYDSCWGNYPEGVTTKNLTTDIINYIVGEKNEYEYALASRYSSIERDSEGVVYGAGFGIAVVSNGAVGCKPNPDVYFPYNKLTLYSNEDKGGSDCSEVPSSIRPIVVLPSDIKVEKEENGNWNIIADD